MQTDNIQLEINEEPSNNKANNIPISQQELPIPDVVDLSRHKDETCEKSLSVPEESKGIDEPYVLSALERYLHRNIHTNEVPSYFRNPGAENLETSEMVDAIDREEDTGTEPHIQRPNVMVPINFNNNNLEVPDQNDNPPQQNNDNSAGFIDLILQDENLLIEQYIIKQAIYKLRNDLALIGVQLYAFVILVLCFSGLYNFTFLVGLVVAAQLPPLGIAMFKLRKRDITNRAHRWRSLVILDWISLVQFEIFLIYTVSGKGQILQYMTLPGFAICFAYILFTDLSKTVKNRAVTLRIIFWCQMLLISFKLTGKTEISWSLALIGVWIFIGILLLLTGFHFFFMTLSICVMARGGRLFTGIARKIQLVSLVWYFLYLSISIVLLIFVISLSSYLGGNEKEIDIMQFCAGAGIIHNITTLVYGCFSRSELVQFTAFTLRQQYRLPATNYTGQNAPPKIVSEKTEALVLFDMISPTYFTKLEAVAMKFQSRDILNSFKNKVRELKKSIDGYFVKRPENSGIKEITREKIKEELKLELKTKQPKKGHSQSMAEIYNSEDRNTTERLSLSENDIVIAKELNDFTKNIMRNNIKSVEDFDNLCYICCTKEANAIFLKCGHGGMCHECAQESWKKQNTCGTCRKPVDEIVVLHPIKNMNMAKGTIITKKVYSDNRENPQA